MKSTPYIRFVKYLVPVGGACMNIHELPMLYVGVSLRQKKYYRLLKLQLHGLFRKGKVSVLIINCNSSHDLNILCIMVVYYVINTKTLLSFRNNSLNNLRFEERACTNFSVPFVCAWSQRHAHNMGNS